MTPAPTQAMPVAHYWIKQRFTPMVNRYEICESDAAGQVGRMLAFAQQKRMKLREESSSTRTTRRVRSSSASRRATSSTFTA